MGDYYLAAVLSAIALAREQTGLWYSQQGIDYLSSSLMVSDPSSEVYAQGLRRLRGLCRTTGLTPLSSIIQSEIAGMSLRPISQTPFSDVWKGSLMGQNVAVKVLRLHADEHDHVAKAYLHELIIWQHLRHPNIVPFIGTVLQIGVSLVSEWMSGGTVTAFLRVHPDRDRIVLASEVEQGLSFMHHLDIVHGDLKAANVLVDASGVARVTDFGLAIVMHATATAPATGACGVAGSRQWMAPELLDPEHCFVEGEGAEGSGKPTKQSDLYALALTVWEIFSGEIPWRGMGELQFGRRVLKGERPKRSAEHTARGLDEAMWETLVQWWHTLPSARPSLSAPSVITQQKTSRKPVRRAGMNIPPGPLRMVLQKLLNRDIDRKLINDSEWTALHIAAQDSSELAVLLLLHHDANPNVVDNQGRTALHLAAESGSKPVVQLLLNHGANANAVNIQGETALHSAAQSNSESVVQLLLGHGADLQIADHLNRTALHWAALIGSELVVRLLLDHGASPKALDDLSRTALHWAAEIGSEPVVRLLLKHDADPNVDDDVNNATALHLAVQSGSEPVVRLLLDHGTDLESALDKDGSTALHLAAEGSETIVRLLIDHGAVLEAGCKYRCTPLHRAAQSDSEPTARLLINYGANPKATDECGRTPLAFAKSQSMKTLLRDCASAPRT